MQFSHLIAPAKVIRGPGAWGKSLETIKQNYNSPLFIGKSATTENIRFELTSDLKNSGIKISTYELSFGCCEFDLRKAIEISNKSNCDCVIAAGGGKVLDAGKLIGDQINKPCITIPLSAATCAGWTALSNIYSPQGAFIRDKVLKRAPELLIFDHELIKEAPKRTLASGIADALAKWYEASLTSAESSDGLAQQAVQMARVLRDQLFIDAKEALRDSNSDSWVRVAEGCGLTAGVIGGIGGAKCRTAAAHAFHNGLTQLPSSTLSLHGEIVGFGILVQLSLEELITGNQLAKQAKNQLIPLLKSINIPTNLDELGFKEVEFNQLKEITEFACKSDSDIHNLPFKVGPKDLLNSILIAGDIKSRLRKVT